MVLNDGVQFVERTNNATTPHQPRKVLFISDTKALAIYAKLQNKYHSLCLTQIWISISFFLETLAGFSSYFIIILL